MKTQNTKLNFSKYSVSELNQDQLKVINGGTNFSIVPINGTLGCTFCINSSNGAGGDLLNQIKEN